MKEFLSKYIGKNVSIYIISGSIHGKLSKIISDGDDHLVELEHGNYNDYVNIKCIQRVAIEK